MKDQDVPKPEEEIEAKELAKALEGREKTGRAPEDAFETAAMLRYTSGRNQLSKERKEALLERVLDDPTTAEPPSWWASWSFRWIVSTGLASGVAALALVVALQGDEELFPTTLPPPSEDLLAAQMAAVSGEQGAFEMEMSRYRSDVYGALSRRYGAGE